MNKLENSELFEQKPQFGVPILTRDPIKKQMSQAVLFYQKLCLKFYYNSNSTFVNSLKQENLRLYLDSYTLKDMNLINQTIAKFLYFKSISISGKDPQRGTRSEENKSNKIVSDEQKAKEGDIDNKFHHISNGIYRNLGESSVNLFKLIHLDIYPEEAELFSNGIRENKTLKRLVFSNCNFRESAFEILLKCVLTHTIIEHIELTNNKLNDKCGNMISRIISRQCQRRDQVIWMYGLRNEKPFIHHFSQGLVSINISNNNLSDNSAEDLSNAILYDAYLRSIDVSNNQIGVEGCKKFIHALRKNVSLLNLDLRGNPGYLVDNVHKRLLIKLARNIKSLKEIDFTENELIYIYQFINNELFDLKGINQNTNLNKKISVLLDNANVTDSTFNNSNNFQVSRISGKGNFEQRRISHKLSQSQKISKNSTKLKSNETTFSERKKDLSRVIHCNSCEILRKDFDKLKKKCEELSKENSNLKNSLSLNTNRSQTLKTSRSVSSLNKKGISK